MSHPEAPAHISGQLLGRRLDESTGEVLADIIHITEPSDPQGPAENAIVMFEHDSRRARYLSWINYYDLDYVIAHESSHWQIIEPSQPYRAETQWEPFSWPGALPAPTVGDFAGPPSAANG